MRLLCLVSLLSLSSLIFAANERLVEAVRVSNLAGVEEALEDDANPNYQGVFNEETGGLYPVLVIAASLGDVNISNALILAGASVDFSSDEGTALHIAAQYGHVNLVELLLNNEADPALTDSEGRTPRGMAAFTRNLLMGQGGNGAEIDRLEQVIEILDDLGQQVHNG